MITDRTDYADGTQRKRVEYMPRSMAREALALILRRARRQTDVCIIRDRFDGVHRQYWLTNVSGRMRFERTITISN